TITTAATITLTTTAAAIATNATGAAAAGTAEARRRSGGLARQDRNVGVGEQRPAQRLEGRPVAVAGAANEVPAAGRAQRRPVERGDQAAGLEPAVGEAGAAEREPHAGGGGLIGHLHAVEDLHLRRPVAGETGGGEPLLPQVKDRGDREQREAVERLGRQTAVRRRQLRRADRRNLDADERLGDQ